MKEVVLATLNPGKIQEMTDILRPFGITPRSLRDLPAIDSPRESGMTFLENATIKASYYSIETSLPCVADDSGLEVDVLEGAPGIYSSRFAREEASDDENMIRLIAVLGDKPRPWNARFVCSAAYAEAGRVIATYEGELLGEIIPEKRGASGFGYDPVFFLKERGLTVAELAAREKNRISHRRKAIEGLIRQLREMNVI